MSKSPDTIFDFSQPGYTKAVKSAQRVKNELLAFIEEQPFLKATVKDNSTITKVILLIDSTRLDRQEFGDTIHIVVEKKRWSDTEFVVLVNRFCRTRRARVRKYTRIGKANLKKIAKSMTEGEEETNRSVQSAKVQANVSGQWKDLQAEKLKGVIIPPGFTVSIVQDLTEPPTPDTVPVFKMSATSYGSFGIKDYDLTADQITKIANAISEALGLDRAFAIVGDTEEHGSQVWDGSYFRTLREGVLKGRPYSEEQAAKDEVARIVSVYREGITNIRAVPFKELF
ncbi:MAG: hypothetical protein ACYSUV_02065 [Planctomycetota bacterium]|jgi:hypothetical protein